MNVAGTTLPTSEPSLGAANRQPPPVGNLLTSVSTIAEFQLRRMLTRSRLAVAAIGILFPSAVIAAVGRTAGFPLDNDLAGLLIYALVPEAVCVLALLVTMCPAVADELERGTWIHVAVRPGGRRAMILGTYAAAVVWTVAVGSLSLIPAVIISGAERPLQIFFVMLGLVLLSAAGRGALFSLPAVIVPKRAMVASVGLAIVVEYLAGTLPAVINQATVSLRLRSLLVEGMGWRRQLPAELQLLIDSQPAVVQVMAVGLLVTILLTAAVVIVERRQFPPSEEI
jgi:ABC-type transport system involved in multi-copper enzyme maturation permease subunit